MNGSIAFRIDGFDGSLRLGGLRRMDLALSERLFSALSKAPRSAQKDASVL
jgi:hypothetical protein